MNFIKATLAILFIFSLLVGCTPAAKPTPAPAIPPAAQPAAPSGALEFTNPAQRITVPVGVSFTINVNANPTTGYTWEVGFDQSLLKLVKRYTPSGTGMIGAGGVEISGEEHVRGAVDLRNALRRNHPLPPDRNCGAGPNPTALRLIRPTHDGKFRTKPVICLQRARKVHGILQPHIVSASKVAFHYKEPTMAFGAVACTAGLILVQVHAVVHD